jgi:hypothetical protein
MAMKRIVDRFYWTEGREALLRELRDDEAMDWPDIANELGRPATAGACETHYSRLISRQRIAEGKSLSNSKVPNAVAIESDRRIAARSARDQAALERGHVTFGDPPPGYSALDGKTGMT